jgi:hypothetical protein
MWINEAAMKRPVKASPKVRPTRNPHPAPLGGLQNLAPWRVSIISGVKVVIMRLLVRVSAVSDHP